MNTSTLKRLAAGTAAAAALAATAGTTALTLTTPTAAAAVPGGTVLRTLADDALHTVTGGLLTPAIRPVPRAHVVATNGNGLNSIKFG